VGLDIPLIVSAVLNLVLVAVSVILASKGMKLGELLGKANKKLADIVALVNNFMQAYQDRVITKEEAQKLISMLEELIKDP